MCVWSLGFEMCDWYTQLWIIDREGGEGGGGGGGQGGGRGAVVLKILQLGNNGDLT